MSQYNNATIWQYSMTEQYDNTKISQCNNTTIWQYNMHHHTNTTTWQYHNTTTWQYNMTEQYENTTTSPYNSTTIWLFNMTEQYGNTPISQYTSQYACTFICIKTFMIRLENLHKVVRIDNIWSASDHGMNNICKLVIECETLVFFAWWTKKELLHRTEIKALHRVNLHLAIKNQYVLVNNIINGWYEIHQYWITGHH